MREGRAGKTAALAAVVHVCLRRAWCRYAWLALSGTIATSGLVGIAPVALADEAVAVTDLGEVVVTARRRDEKIIEAPVAVTVETGEQLKEQDAILFEDVAREVPNLRMMPSPQSVSAMDVTIRGQTALRSAIAYDPAVGIYVDGVYVANGQAAMNTLLDIDTVQIVRGAQGTLFGRNNTGGSISFNTNRPQLGVYSAEVAADGGIEHMFMGRGILNVPMGDTLAFRLAYQNNERDGYGSSIFSGQGDFNDEHRYQVRLGALWRPNGEFDAYWTFEHFNAQEVGALLHPLHGTFVEQIGQLAPGFGLPPVVIPNDFYQTDADLPSHDNTSLDATQLTLTQALGASTSAKLIVAYRHIHNDTAIDVDATSLPLFDTALQNGSSQKSAELQLAGAALEKKLDWVAGLYWFHDDGSAPSQIPAQPVAYQNFFGAFLPASGPLLPCPVPITPCPVQVIPAAVIEVNSLENISSAGFLHGEYHLTERWSAAAGVRRTDDVRKLFENDFTNLPVIGTVCTITELPGACPSVNDEVSFSYWSWEFSTRYRVTEELNGYFRTGRGQRSGGWNIPVNSVTEQPFRPEELTDYELGAKADLLNGVWLINADIFMGNYDQMQRLLPELVNGTPSTYVINAGKARVSGAELESDLRLARAWSLRAAFGFTDARYRQFLYSPGDGLPTIDESHNQFYLTPRYNVGLGIGYEEPAWDGIVRLHADYDWQDSEQFSVFNDFNNQGAYGTLNARAAYLFDHQGHWELAAFGTNLGARQYAVTGGSVDIPASPVPATSWQIPGAPRLYGFELLYRFGPSR
ncbi:MAG TPA: TonB-dependent receptor [Burkholderiaceae bacterium]|nr:TonB-dependent receptor [Burkholderiaceae bacterium]